MKRVPSQSSPLATSSPSSGFRLRRHNSNNIELPFTRQRPLKMFSSSVWTVLRRLGMIRICFLALATAFTVQRYLSMTMGRQLLVAAPITTMPGVRTCPRPKYPTLQHHSSSSGAKPPLKICLTTLTDEYNKSMSIRYLGWRNFDGLMGLTWENRENYARKHGYYLYDESNMLDPSRPPSWSKIRAVQRLLTQEACDWVFWMDADTVVMNSEIRLESFLPIEGGGDFLVAHEGEKGYNAGSWIVRNSPWTIEFLQTWWDMKQYVRMPGQAKSGDNDALKALLKQERLSKDSTELLKDHVLVPPQCTFNSFSKWLTPKVYSSVMTTSGIQLQQQDLISEWYRSEHWYHKGDFVAHVAGVDNKAKTVRELVSLAI